VQNESRDTRRESTGELIPAWVWLVAAVLGALLLFLPLILSQLPFLCDDYTVIATNIHKGKLSPDRILQQFVEPPAGVSDRYYRPFFYMSFALDFWIGQNNPLVYYLMNILFHALTAWLLYMMLRFLNAGPAWALLSMWIFLCHPVHIETVSWISARSSSLAALFTLGALASFARYRRTHHWPALLGTGLLFGSGLLTREVVVIVPGLMLVIDLFIKQPSPTTGSPPTPRPISRLLAPYLLAALILGAYLLARSFALGSSETGYTDLVKDLFQFKRIEQILIGFSRYFVPCMESLTGELALWKQLLVALPSLALLLMGLGRISIRARGGLGLLALCLFGFATLPGLPILQVNQDLMNSRMFYLPSAGLSILLAAGALSLGRGKADGVIRTLKIASATIVILGGAVLLVFNQQAVRAAGDEASEFLTQVRNAGVRTLVLPRTAFFPYADRDGDGIKNDATAYFAPLQEEESLTAAKHSIEAEGALALLINAPRVVKGVYVFWGSLDMALLPLYGEPGIEVLYTEMSPIMHPEGSFFGPLLQDGIELLKWDGQQLRKVRPESIAADSEAGRDFEKAAPASLGTPDLHTSFSFPADAFKPVMTLPDSSEAGLTYRYRALTPFGASMVNAHPRREGDRLLFDPYNDPEAGPIFQALKLLKPNPAASSQSRDGTVSLPCFLMIESLKEGQVQARSRHLRFRIQFP